MTPPALPPHWQELVAGYVLDTLSPEETALVEGWLSRYPEVVAELAQLQATWHSLPENLPPIAPPEAVKQRVLHAVTAPTRARSRRVASRGLVYALSTGWAITAIALFSLWQENQQLRQTQQQTQAILANFEQPSSYFYLLSGADANPHTSARLAINPETRSAAIVTQNLPPLPSDRVYRLWGVVNDEPTYCGEFNPVSGEGFNQWQLPPDCDAIAATMLVTQELQADPPIPQG
ncbi:MAG: anti-sigma factor, partial [Jaaginema sp. PMC 1079.18]|nr:anti-sigma factor [Jaaginema sp. PMC 1079.18]